MPGLLGQHVAAMLREQSAVLERADGEAWLRLVDIILESPVLFTAGAGRSGLLLRAASMRFMHLGLKVHIVGDTLTPGIMPGDRLLVASGSGETAQLVSVAKKARDMRAGVLLITANPRSAIAGMADHVLVLEAPTPKADLAPARSSSQPMGSLFEQSLFLCLEAAVLEIMRRTEVTADDMFRKHANLE